MTDAPAQIEILIEARNSAQIIVETLGNFELQREGTPVTSKEWGRLATIQLFQYFITNRHRNGIHKEQIIDRIWGDVDSKTGNQNFKVAHHGVNKVLEPERKSREESKYIIRQGSTYLLKTDHIWIDAEAMEKFVALGNKLYTEDPKNSQLAYYEAINLYGGIFLPDRLYEDWSSEERERLQLLALGALINLSEMLIKSNPMECVRLAQQAIQIDHTWEDAYRIQMQAYFEKGNRPMAIKTYKRCEEVLRKEFGIDPLPETLSLLKRVQGKA